MEYKIMHLKTKMFLLVFIVVNLSFPLYATETEPILQLFKDSFNWMDYVAFHAEISGGSSFNPSVHYSVKSNYYNDHSRQISFTVTERAQNALTGEALGEGRAYRSIFSEQMNGFFHTISVAPEDYTKDFEGTLYSYEDGSDAYRYHLATQPSLSPFFGVNVLFSYEPIYDLLKPDVVKLREDSHNGRRSVVIEAQIPEGHIELWVAPDRGYTMQKYRLTKVAGEDLDSDGSIFQPETYFSNISENSVPLKRLIIEGTVEEEQESLLSGYVIPTQVNRIIRFENEEGAVDREEIFVNTLSNIDFNPDFEALKAFDFRVPNGTVTFLTKKNGQRMSGLKWQDGELVIDVDADTLDDNITNALVQIKTGSPSLNKNKGGVSLQMDGLGGASGFLFRHGRLLTWIAGALLLLACGVVGTLSYISGKGKADMAATETRAVEESTTSTVDRKEHE